MGHRYTRNDQDEAVWPLTLRQVQLPGGPVQVGARQMVGLQATNPSRVWQRSCVCLVIRGRGRYRSQDAWQPVDRGTVFCHPRGRDHVIERADPAAWVEWSLTIDPLLEDLVHGLGCMPGDHDPAQDQAQVRKRLAARWRLQSAMEGPGPAGSILVMALLEFLHALRSRETVQDPVQAAADELAADLRGDLAISAVARQAGLSAVHFRRVFKNRFGCGPAAYRDRSRMQRARVLLRDEGLDVAATAAQLGYATGFAFSRHFRAVVGEPPGRWCRRQRDG